jgi:hypothetical protein
MVVVLRAFTATMAVLLAAAHQQQPTAPTAAVTLGVVRYSEDVQQIWADLQAALCEDHRVCFAVQLFNAYDDLEEALFDGRVAIAWNGPVAHVRSERRAERQGDRLVSLGMRDSDVDFEVVIVSTTPPPAEGGVAAVRAVIETAAHVRGVGVSLGVVVGVVAVPARRRGSSCCFSLVLLHQLWLPRSHAHAGWPPGRRRRGLSAGLHRAPAPRAQGAGGEYHGPLRQGRRVDADGHGQARRHCRRLVRPSHLFARTLPCFHIASRRRQIESIPEHSWTTSHPRTTPSLRHHNGIRDVLAHILPAQNA